MFLSKTKVDVLTWVNNFVKSRKIPTCLLFEIMGDPIFWFQCPRFWILRPKEGPGDSGNLKNGLGRPKYPYFDIPYVSLASHGAKRWQKHFSRGNNPFDKDFLKNISKIFFKNFSKIFSENFQRFFQKFSENFSTIFKDFFSKIFQRFFKKFSKIFSKNFQRFFQKFFKDFFQKKFKDFLKKFSKIF